MHRRVLFALPLAALAAMAFTAPAWAGDEQPRADQRFADGPVKETPSFQRHVIPLLGRLGCNGRACHGSFQGQGDFRLSLFGYDFKADHQALMAGDEPRVNVEDPSESLIITKPTDEDLHDGGKRYDRGGWEHRLLMKWIRDGAPNDGGKVGYLKQLEVTPSEIRFEKADEKVQLRAVAHWSDGTREDVTPLCRFRTNDESVAEVDEQGVVTSLGRGDTHVVVFYDNGVTPIPVLRPVSDKAGPDYPRVAASTEIDRLVIAKLTKLGVVPSEPCTDAEFLRRVSLDMIGTLPTAKEVTDFLADNSPNKRLKKIDELLERPEYAAWWATRFSDLTGNNPQNGGNNQFRSQESQQWYHWLQKRLAENVPYDKIVEGIVLANGRRDGQSYKEYCAEMSKYYIDGNEADFADHDYLPHYWSRRNIRQPEEKALSFAYTFMGVRLQCAQCHKHPFDQWSKEDFDKFTSFFAAVQYGNRKEDAGTYRKMLEQAGLKGKRNNELRKLLPKLLEQGKAIPLKEVFASVEQRRRNRGKNKNRRPQPKVLKASLLGGEELTFTEGEDPRKALMDWMRQKRHPYFAKAIVNRIWAGYFNVGIIEPPDDLNLANPPSNRALLEHLTQGFMESGYDLKWLHRQIAASDTYQRSWRPNDTNVHDRRNFSRAVPRRLPAEVAYDALKQAAGSDSREIDIEDRAIGVKVNTTYRGNRGATYALATFGKPERVSNCDCERSTEPSLLQTLYLRNDAEVLNLITQRGGWLDQVAREHRLDFTASSRGGRGSQVQRQLARFSRDAKRAQRQIADARKAGNKKKVAELLDERKKLLKRIARLRGQGASPASDAAAGEGSAKADPKVVSAKGPQLIEQIYLRTVSRPPTGEETERALTHLRNSRSVAAGLRDVLWAVINTKEFIVNH